MENRIPRDNEYKDIEISELGFRELTDKENILVQKFVKNNNSTYYLFSVMGIIFGCLFIALAIYNIVFLKDNEVLFVGLGGALIFFLVGFMFSRNIIPKNKKCVKVQDGILNGVWKKTSGSTSNSTVHYYLDVIFPLNGTRCRKINCHEEDYKKGKVGSNVLVFSFNNTKGFGIVKDDM